MRTKLHRILGLVFLLFSTVSSGLAQSTTNKPLTFIYIEGSKYDIDLYDTAHSIMQGLCADATRQVVVCISNGNHPVVSGCYLTDEWLKSYGYVNDKAELQAVLQYMKDFGLKPNAAKFYFIVSEAYIQKQVNDKAELINLLPEYLAQAFVLSEPVNVYLIVPDWSKNTAPMELLKLSKPTKYINYTY